MPDSLFASHWYNFYNNAYSELVTSHAALFGGLIAVTIALFAFKYWIDNKKFNEEVNKKMSEIQNETERKFKEKLGDAEERIKSLEKRCSNLVTLPRKLYIQSIIVNKGTKNINKTLLNAVKEWLNTSNDDELASLIVADFMELYEQIKQSLKIPHGEEEKIIAKDIVDKIKDIKQKNSDKGVLMNLDDVISYFESIKN